MMKTEIYLKVKLLENHLSFHALYHPSDLTLACCCWPHISELVDIFVQGVIHRLSWGHEVIVAIKFDKGLDLLIS